MSNVIISNGEVVIADWRPRDDFAVSFERKNLQRTKKTLENVYSTRPESKSLKKAIIALDKAIWALME